VLLLVLLLGAGYQSVRIEGVPHVKQKPDYCGEACVEMWLRKLGRKQDQDWVFAQSGVDPELSRGVWTPELKRALERIGFERSPVWFHVDARRAGEEMEAMFAELHRDLMRGVPSIVCMHYDGRPNTTEHFRLILGYDAASDEIIYHEPAERDGAYRRMKRRVFLELWPLRYDPRSWTVIRLPLELAQ
jgi:hypothetical protein